jgi:hypothetical protein
VDRGGKITGIASIEFIKRQSMSILIQYLFKLSISLAIVWLFYQLVLRKLTFFNSNRWYLLGYTALCFFIPFINVNDIVESGQAGSNNIISMIPSVESYTNKVENFSQCPAPVLSMTWDKWDWTLLVMSLGAGFLFLRFCIRCISFLRLKSRATLLSGEGMKLYHVNDSIIPFSFGNSIFINRELHAADELQEIIRHEFVHVKQRHTIDIIWSELLCMLTWYNPFAWLLRADIRQNLEFIADNKVLANGINKKQYQYLLLKVIGNNHFSIAQKFNFSSLKKRIAMMNKIKTAKVHLLRFLFILPLLAVILVSFRQSNRKSNTIPAEGLVVSVCDTVPTKTANEKGYFIEVKGAGTSSKVIVQDKVGKTVETVSLKNWKNNSSYEKKYGSLPMPPHVLPPIAPTPPLPPLPPIPVALPENVETIDIRDKKATVTLKDGKIEKYDLNKPDEKATFEKKYGKTPEPPIPPRPPVRTGVTIATVDGQDRMATLCEDFEITNEKAIMRMKNGKTEEYDLTNKDQRQKFESRFGRIINQQPNEDGVSPVVLIGNESGHSVLAPMAPLETTVGALVIDGNGRVINGEVDILVTISKNTSRQELDALKIKMKAIGYALTYDNIEYDDKGVLTLISGQMKSNESQCNFNATDFSKVILSTISSSGKTIFKVDIVGKKVRV